MCATDDGGHSCPNLEQPQEAAIERHNGEGASTPEATCGAIGRSLGDLARKPAGTLMDERALADCLDVSPRTLRRMVKRGQLPNGIKLGGRRMWLAEKVLQFLNDRADELAGEAKKTASRLKFVS